MVATSSALGGRVGYDLGLVLQLLDFGVPPVVVQVARYNVYFLLKPSPTLPKYSFEVEGAVP